MTKITNRRKTNIVSDFLTHKKTGTSATALGKIAVVQSNYFDIDCSSIKRISFDKSLSPKQLDNGYKKVINAISDNLDTLDQVNELILHSKLISALSWLTNSVLIRSSSLKFTLGIGLFLSIAYTAYIMLETNLYPNPIVFAGIGILSWVIGIIKSLLSKQS